VSECVCVDVMMEVACLPVAARSPPRMGGLDGSSIQAGAREVRERSESHRWDGSP